MNRTLDQKLHPETLVRIIGVAFFAYLFFGFMLLPCLNTLTSSTPKMLLESAILLRLYASSSQATWGSMFGIP